MPDVTIRDIAAVVVLYRPESEALPNIRMTASQVDHVFAIDNTEQPDPDFVESLCAVPDLTYVPLGDNLGIATALNAGVGLARDAGYSWALTMDQDSVPEADMVAALCSCATSCDQDPIAILAPRHVQPGTTAGPADRACRPVLTTMTSGDLLSTEAWDRVGGFDETLFIDSVDHDMCLKLDGAGLRVVECGEAVLAHPVGRTTEETLPVRAHPSHHNALRRYYITRNRLVVADRYRTKHPEFRRDQVRATWRELAKIVLFEDHKVAKLRMSWRGYRDYKRGVTGPYRDR
jgi:rhamnosyltransferase